MFQWNIKNADETQSPPLPMPEMIWQILQARGVESQQAIEELFSPQLKKLRDPYLLKGMNVAVERMLKVFKEQEHVCIYADFDLDGTSGLALLHTALQDLGYKNVSYYQPKRLSEGYGVHVHAIEEIAKRGTSLIVTIDVGITDLKAAAKAKELGLDYIVTDHHLPKEQLPEALTVINPNSGECDSGLGHLCGTGVAFFLLLALRRALGEAELLIDGFQPKSYLDCFVIGTLTDLVPVIDENRILCKHGLVQLAKTERPGLRFLLQELGLWGKPLTSQDVAFKFAPKLNALSRLENSFMPIELYLEKDEAKARSLVDEVLQINDQRRSLQKSAEEKALKIYRDQPTEGFAFVFDEEFHKGVVGLVATRLSQELGVPSFVGTVKNGAIVGSARSPEQNENSLLDALDASAEALTRFGGHRQAAGFELPVDESENFAQSLSEFYMKNQSPVCLPELRVEAKGQLNQVTPQLMKWLDHLGPFGTQFDTPCFLFENIELKGVRELRGGHYKLKVGSGSFGAELDALWFSPAKAHPLRGEAELNQAGKIDLVAEPTWNEFAGRKTLQLLVKDLRAHS